jgi:hypothetical protein
VLLSIALLAALVQVGLARSWASHVGKTNKVLRDEFRKELYNIRMPLPALLLVIGAGLGWYFHVPVVIDMSPLLVLPFLLAGLSLLHAVTFQYRRGVYALVLVYLLLFLLSYWMALVVAAIGLLDTLMNVRQRWLKVGPVRRAQNDQSDNTGD